MNLTFSGKRALIIGGTCELALTLAQHMIASALFPILTHRSEAGLKAIHRELLPFTGKYETAYLEFGTRESLQTLFPRIGEDLDYLVDFAQGNYENLIASADEETLYRYFTENVSFRAELLKTAARVMLKKRRGRLVFISSAAAESPNPGQGFYAASKLASEALYRSMGLELGGRGITTVILRPGYVTAGRGKAFLNARGEDILEKIPVKRAITGEEIAETVLFLLADSASAINATVITMDGGLTSRK
ncbi:MAG: SDR family oxidoreductase [Deltaproteobacteria bacterium]|nr:SDR family oxidoreductase [Deltaproteobacteria bacterium]